MSDILQVADQYYVLATSILADHDTRVLKQGETFAIFDSYGDIQPVTHSEAGVFHKGTRHLSRLELLVFDDQRPLLLNSTLRDDNGLLKVDLTNRDLNLPDHGFYPRGSVYIHREKFLLDDQCMEHVAFSNYGPIDVEINVAVKFDADFRDIFEVRGQTRPQRGELRAPERRGDRIVHSYMGLDGIERFTTFACSRKDFALEDKMIRMKIKVPARGQEGFYISVAFSENRDEVHRDSYASGLKKNHADHMAGRQAYCGVRTSNEQFDSWMRRSTDDLVMMTTETDRGGSYPYAGIPWFCAAFGRDGIITALQCLWANPSLAKGVIQYLAATQAKERIPEREATPGKIIHEVRFGEMANLKEIPFGMYYGSIDSTPLFVILGGQYLTRTGDVETIRANWPAFEQAIFWLDRYGDRDGDGFIEYERENPNGLIHQGWKDSTDSIFHADGRDARGPIALCEVQGYAYKAKIEGAKMAEAIGLRDLAESLRNQAEDFKEKFDRAFWLDDLKTFALALDGDKKPCRVKSSNAGHCLFSGIVKDERVPALVETLMAPESFSGWGIRTIAADAARFNPMSYHNGSVWPHDVSLVAWGIAKAGYKDEVERIFNGMFRSAMYMDLQRMPEVYCGFARREGEAPTLYPHACSPQAWAAGSVYVMLQSLLGIKVDGWHKRVSFSRPRLPDSLETVRITGLEVGGETIDVVVQNYVSDVSVQIARRGSGITVTVEK